MTYSLIGLPMALMRLIATFVSAVTAGLFQILFNSPEEEPREDTARCCHKKEATLSPAKKLYSILRYGFYDLLRDMSVWLTAGLLLGALIVYFTPDDLFLRLSPGQGRLLILAAGIPLYVCASATTPIAAALILKGMSPGTALLLLLVGPATNISNLTIIQKYIGKKGVLINVLSITAVALAMSFSSRTFSTTPWDGGCPWPPTPPTGTTQETPGSWPPPSPSSSARSWPMPSKMKCVKFFPRKLRLLPPQGDIIRPS